MLRGAFGSLKNGDRKLIGIIRKDNFVIDCRIRGKIGDRYFAVDFENFQERFTGSFMRGGIAGVGKSDIISELIQLCTLLIGYTFQNQGITFNFSFYIGIFPAFEGNLSVMSFVFGVPLLVGHVHGHPDLQQLFIPVFLLINQGFQLLICLRMKCINQYPVTKEVEQEDDHKQYGSRLFQAPTR